MLCVAVALKSNSRSRKENGRMFWPLLNNPVLDQVNPGLLGLYNTAAASLADRYISGTVTLDSWELVVVTGKAKSPLKPNPNPNFWTRVKSVRVNPLVSSLRSRKVGVGS
jgi:hypothetical protein